AVPILREAQSAIEDTMSQTEQMRWMRAATVAPLHVWDVEGSGRLSDLHLPSVRETGALSELPIALGHRGQAHVFAGELGLAASLEEAIQETTDLTGRPLARYPGVSL